MNQQVGSDILSNMTEREFALEVVRKLHEAGYQALWAGGCVRDELLGLKPDDYDVATDARPDQLRALFKKRNEIGASFGVVQIIGPRGEDREWLTVEVATFRSDGTYSDGRRPDAVVYSSPEEDAKRRDFTINGLFFDPVKEKLIDYVGGQADLEAKRLRAIGDPFARFTEDKLRILRAVRMATRFDLAIDSDTLAAAQRMANEIRVVSPERITEEYRKLLVHPNRARGLSLLQEFGLIEPILPELMPFRDRWHEMDRVMEELGAIHSAKVSFPLAFAVIVLRLEKQSVERIADRLRFSSAEKSRVVWLVGNQSCLLDAPTMRLSRLKTILIHPGIAELLALHRARAMAFRQPLEGVEFCERMLRDMPPEEMNPLPVLTGQDLIAAGMKPGPEFKRLLDAIREAQLEGEVKSTQDAMDMVNVLLRGK